MGSEKIPTIDTMNIESMVHLEGDPEVFRSLYRKKELLNKRDVEHEKIRPLLIAMPGTMRGVAGGGQVTALSEMGFVDVFDHALGISTGAPTVAYFVSGQAAIGTSIYYEDLPRNNFISFGRFLSGGSMVDIDFLYDIFSGKVGNKRLDTNRLLKSRTKVHIVTTEYDTGRPKIFDIDGSIDPVQILRASAAIPALYKTPVVINDKRYIDGGVSMTLPPKRVIDTFNPTDILILANRTKDAKETKIERWLASILLFNMPDGVRKSVLNSEENMISALNDLRSDPNRRYVIIWSDDLSFREMNPNNLRKGALDAYKHMLKILNKYRAT